MALNNTTIANISFSETNKCKVINNAEQDLASRNEWRKQTKAASEVARTGWEDGVADSPGTIECNLFFVATVPHKRNEAFETKISNLYRRQKWQLSGKEK